MSGDPFVSLRADDGPVAPRPEFAAQLRTLLEAELRPVASAAPDRVRRPGTGEPSWLYYFTLPAPDLVRSMRFYHDLFGWDIHPNDAGDGAHVDGVHPAMGLDATGETEPRVWFVVDDVARIGAEVRAAGGTVSDVLHYESGDSIDCVDDQGVRFAVNVPSYDTAPEPSRRHGELFYFSLPYGDAERARRFYARVLRWEFDPPGTAGGMHVANVQPDGGLAPGAGAHPALWFRVDDLDDAMATVGRLGGTAEFAGEGPEGRHAACVDDQGVGFGISQPAG